MLIEAAVEAQFGGEFRGDRLPSEHDAGTVAHAGRIQEIDEASEKFAHAISQRAADQDEVVRGLGGSPDHGLHAEVGREQFGVVAPLREAVPDDLDPHVVDGIKGNAEDLLGGHGRLLSSPSQR